MNVNNRGEIALSVAPFFQIVVLMIQDLLIISNMVTHESFRIVSIILSAIPMGIAMIYVIHKNPMLFFNSYLIVLIIIIVNLSVFPDNKEFVKEGAFYLLGINLPCYLCLASITSIDVLKRVMLIISYILLALGILYLMLFVLRRVAFVNYSIDFTYYLLLPALVFLSYRKIWFTLFFIVIFAMMLLLGSRGALVTVIIFALLLSIIDRKNRTIILISTFFIILLSGSFFALYLTFSNKASITSRTLSLIQEGNIAESSGRIDLYTKTWNSIVESPIIGHGIYGDRVVLDGSYCHNIILEMLHNFGLIAGSILVFMILFAVIRIYLTSDNDLRKLLLIFFCYSFIPLLVSTSYLDDPKFGILVGALFLLSKNTKITAHSP